MTDAATIAKGLTEAQRRALLADRSRGDSAYNLRSGLNTLSALAAKGLVARVGDVGDMAFPHTSINWPLTTLGSRVLRILEGGEKEG